MALDLTSMAAGGALVSIIMAFLAFFVIIGIILWVYISFAFMAIGKKAKVEYPGLAWIPGVGPALIAFFSSKNAWWPWLLIIGMFIPFIGFLFSIAFAVYGIIWQWKMFEKVGKPGWWAILALIPIVNLVLYGIAAWSKN
jgi:hypothetical protein